ncbi:hypothetical protein HS7_20090 [Sulfolobales archaeon HS-7]|nr:hypothetical protein HS7_20090 [Sulfolobales archaeon HS-7]
MLVMLVLQILLVNKHNILRKQTKTFLNNAGKTNNTFVYFPEFYVNSVKSNFNELKTAIMV